MKNNSHLFHLSVLKMGLITYGFMLTVTQVILMRELVSIFSGNELAVGILLAVWLGWTAIGSGVLGKFFVRWRLSWGSWAGLLLGLAVLLPLTLYLNRISLRLLNLPLGEIAGLPFIFAIPLVTLSGFCLCSAALFTLGCRIYSQIQPQEKAVIGRVYILEAIGAAIGGAVASLFLLNHFSAYEIATFLGVLQTLPGVFFLIYRQTWPGRLLLFGSGVFALIGWFSVTSWLEKDAQTRFWQNAPVIKTENSVYGTLTVISRENAHSFFSNGLLVATVPDLYSAEEAVYWAMLQHPAPQNILLIGGGIGGGLQQILAHTDVRHVDYVELDPNLVRLAQATLPPSETAVLNDARVKFHFMDGRLFLKKHGQQYDVILSTLPDPSSTLLNRFYTLEFFREVRQRLQPNGILGFRITSAENYITGHLAEYICCIQHTLEQVFGQVMIIPGITNYLLATPTPGNLTDQPEKLIARMHERQLQPEFVNEYYLPFRLSPERISYLHESLQQVKKPVINQDFKPVAYFFDTLLWSAQTDPVFRDVFGWLARHVYQVISAGFLVAFIIWFWRWQRVMTALAAAVGLAGFTQIGLEVILIIAFQALYGYAYYLIAVIVAGFMVGMAAGSWRAVSWIQRGNLWRRLGISQLALLLVSSGLGVIFYVLSQVRLEIFSALVTELIFLGLAILAGFWGGYLFPVASEIGVRTGQRPEKAGGTLYGFDLLGACAGALFTSAFFVPLLGIYGALLLFACANAGGFGLITLTSRKFATI